MERRLKPIQNCSRFWRVERSNREASELALALRALRKVAGHLGTNVKPVYWRGMAEEDGKSILVDPGMARGSFPVGHKVFDRMAGQVVCQALASMEWTEWVEARAARAIKETDAFSRPFLMSLVQAGEDIFVHSLTKQPVWDLYLVHHFQDRVRRAQRDPALPPSPESLAHAWRLRAIWGQVLEGFHFYYQQPLEILEGVATDLARLSAEPDRAVRREGRAALYEQMIADIHQRVLLEWERYVPDDEAVHLPDEGAPPGDPPDEPNEEDRPEESDREEKEENHNLNEETAQKVREILEDEESDATRRVAVAVADPEAGAMETLIRQGRAPADVQPDPGAVARLSAIFRRHEAVMRRAAKKSMRKALPEGKLDSRRLYRAPLDGRVFKNRQAPGNRMLWQVGIVADASASMSGRGPQKPWQTAEKAFVSLALAARGTRNHVEIFAYQEEAKKCVLTRLNHGGGLYTVAPGGRTPSGQAILAAAAGFGGKFSNNLLIHITDGAANCGAKMSEATRFCKENDIRLFTIGCGVNRQTREFLCEYFDPQNIFFMEHIRFLSAGLEKLLGKTLLQT